LVMPDPGRTSGEDRSLQMCSVNVSNVAGHRRCSSAAFRPQRNRRARHIWQRVRRSASCVHATVTFETHWVDNVRTGQRVEFKTKFPGGD
jgi:hypothetical protein